jgi:hypothetical protein
MSDSWLQANSHAAWLALLRLGVLCADVLEVLAALLAVDAVLVELCMPTPGSVCTSSSMLTACRRQCCRIPKTGGKHSRMKVLALLLP